MSFLLFLLSCVLSLCYAAYWSRRARSIIPFAVILLLCVAAFVAGCLFIALQ